MPDDFSFSYGPGDSIGVCVPNPDESVKAVMARIDDTDCGAKDPSVHLDDGECLSLSAFLRTRASITSALRRRELVSLSSSCSDPREAACLRYLGSKEGSDSYDAFVVANSVSLVDLLNLFPSLRPTPDALKSSFVGVPPRFYSVTSTPLQDASKVTISFSVVDYSTPLTGLRKRGLATTTLENLSKQFLEPDPRFARMPPSMRPKQAAPQVKIFPYPSKVSRVFVTKE